MTTFVSVGNATQGFERLLRAVAVLAPSLPQPVIVQHGATPFANSACDCRAFVSMPEFEGLVASARLLILHAGAGSLIHAVRAGKLPVVMPRRASLNEHVDDHQVEFALELGRAGKIVVALEPADLHTCIQHVLSCPIADPASVPTNSMASLVAAALARCAASAP